MLMTKTYTHRLVAVFVALIFAAAMPNGSIVWAQDDDQSSRAPQSNEQTVDQEDDADEQPVADDDDDTFVPSEEVSSDNSISFPVDI